MRKDTSPKPPPETRGDFDFPPRPLKATQRRGIAIPLLWKLPSETGAAAAESYDSVSIFARPRNSDPRGGKLDNHRLFPRPTLKADSSTLFLVRVPAFAANRPKGSVCRPKRFLFHRARRPLFLMEKTAPAGACLRQPPQAALRRR